MGGLAAEFPIGDRGNESVSPAGERLDIARLLRIVLEHLADFADGAVDAVVGIEKDVFSPDLFRNFFARDELAFLLNQDEQDLQGNALEFQGTSKVAELEGSQIDLEILPKPDGFLRSSRA